MSELDLLHARTADLPRILWIELTSRCPFDCVFCTRASLRGAGEHLDFALYRRLIAELEQPQIIRLNYAGESGHYPQLAQAIALAAGTGAQVELVSALASLKPHKLQAALEAGLNRLTVSLHTLDPQLFQQIYGFSSLDALLQRLEQVRNWRGLDGRPFMLDLAFVAMWRNLAELPAMAAFAQDLGIEVLAVHPLIGRDPLPMGAASEHGANGGLEADFREALAAAVTQARQLAPAVSIQLSSFELEPAHATPGLLPMSWPWPLPPGAQIAGCDQSPFETVHVLADGRAVACEVTEKLTLGDLRQQSLREVWHGPAYQAFRARHLAGQEAACRGCVYKTAHRPGAAQSSIHAANMPAAQLLRGWYADDGSDIRWSAGEAALWLPRSRWRRKLRLHGVLAAPAKDQLGEFRVLIDGQLAHAQAVTEQQGLDLQLPLTNGSNPAVLVELHCSASASPQANGTGKDTRKLGFALIRAELLW